MLEERNFLLPDATFVIEMVAFIVVLVVMTPYVVPRIRRAMQERQDDIASALAAARAADSQRDATCAEASRILARARRDASAITSQARAMRDHLIAEGRKAGADEYRWLSGRASRELQRRNELSARCLRQQAQAASIAAVEAYVGDGVDVALLAQMVDEQFEARTTDASASLVRGRLVTTVNRHDTGDDDGARLPAIA